VDHSERRHEPDGRSAETSHAWTRQPTAWLTAILLSACGGGGGGPTEPGPTPSPPAELLSGQTLYSNIARKEVNPRLKPWVPQYVLWSDGADKERWIDLPAGTRIDTSNMDRWVFPVGTKIWKEFTFLGRRIETRVIEKVAADPSLASWTFKAYQWRPDESDATLASTNGVKDAAPTSFGTTHDIPSVNDCRACHNRGGDAVVGFESLQISGDRDPLAIPAGQLTPGDTTLEDLEREGLITVAPGEQPRIRSSSAAGRWVMGFLHGNCSICHNPQGPAANVGMNLRHTVAALSEEEEPAYNTTVNRLTTTYILPGTTGNVDSFRILGGVPEKSALLFRMQNRGNFHAMPPLASKVSDAGAVNLVTEWIQTLPRR